MTISTINLLSAATADGTDVEVVAGYSEDTPDDPRLVAVQGSGTWNGAKAMLVASGLLALKITCSSRPKVNMRFGTAMGV